MSLIWGQELLNRPVRLLARSKLRAAMRGYRQLRDAGRLDTLPALMRDLTRRPLERTVGKFSSLVMGHAASDGEVCVRQYLLLRLVGTDFNLALLASLARPNARVVYPMPRDWQEAVEIHGFKVARLRSSLLWSAYLVVLMLYGLSESVRTLLSVRTHSKTIVEESSYAYFIGLAKSNLPWHATAEEGRWNVINWYLQWSNRPENIREIRHGVSSVESLSKDEIQIHFQKSPIPPLELKAVPAFLVWLIGALIICCGDLARGRWWHPLLLNQAVLAAQIRLASNNRLAKQYLFNNSGWLYRPLWTFELPAKGSECLLYFYSTNCEGFSRSGLPPVPIYGYESMNWPSYVLWDEPQAEFIRRVAVGSYQIFLAGEIWFSDAPILIPALAGPVLALFDVTPHRTSRYRSLGLGEEFYVPEVAVPGVADVIACASSLGVRVAWKRKRNIGKTVHPRYRNFAAEIGLDERVEMIDADIAASALIAKCDLVISTPYTSTAVLARNSGRPSAYYDPLSMLDQEDLGAHGIPILAGPSELMVWIQANIPSSACEA